MIPIFVISSLALVQHVNPFKWGEPSLVKEIIGWKKGAEAPGRLLQFPDGPPEFNRGCGLRVWGSDVDDYVSRIQDVELLKSMLFDYRADTKCMLSTSRQLLMLRGVKEVRTLLAERRKSNPKDFQLIELATLTQLLESKYARIQAASISKKDVSKEKAENALNKLQADLTAGASWQRAYLFSADRLLDEERSKKENDGWRTFLGYEYAGIVSPKGFDVLQRQISDKLEAQQLQKLFESKKKVHRFETADAYWLYFVEAYYD